MIGHPKPARRPKRNPNPKQSVKELVYQRDGNRCVINGPRCTSVATCTDHRAGRGAGGSRELNTAACLVAACQLCNGFKEDAIGYHRQALEDRGLRVLKAATNALTAARCRETTVLYPDGVRYRLTDDGKRTPVQETREEVAS